MSTSKTAILYFSRSLNDEFKAKGYGLSFERFESLYRFLRHKTLSTIKKSGLDLFESYSDQQRGNSFGERLSTELSAIQSRGYQSVIIVGNDAPELTAQDLDIAKSQLQLGKAVLGADRRGGAYLIAFSFDQVSRQTFQEIDWQTNVVYKQLLDVLDQPLALSQKLDLNEQRDILALRKSAITSRGIKVFLIGLYQAVFGPISIQSFKKEITFFYYRLRGPPAMV